MDTKDSGQYQSTKNKKLNTVANICLAYVTGAAVAALIWAGFNEKKASISYTGTVGQYGVEYDEGLGRVYGGHGAFMVTYENMMTLRDGDEFITLRDEVDETNVEPYSLEKPLFEKDALEQVVIERAGKDREIYNCTPFLFINPSRSTKELCGIWGGRYNEIRNEIRDRLRSDGRVNDSKAVTPLYWKQENISGAEDSL